MVPASAEAFSKHTAQDLTWETELQVLAQATTCPVFIEGIKSVLDNPITPVDICHSNRSHGAQI